MADDYFNGFGGGDALREALRVAMAPNRLADGQMATQDFAPQPQPSDEHGFLFSRVGGDLKFNPYEAVKNFMSYRAPPGALSTSGDDTPIRNAADVAGWVGMSGIGLNAFGAVPANALGSAGARLAPKIENPIIGYHGSPHEFKPEPGFPLGRFKNENIGTGEGAQAFGHGHYIAENEAVAQSYKGAGPLQQWSSLDPPKVDGKMYEVAIHASPDQFLDWDKPLSQQSEAVRKALDAQFTALKDRGVNLNDLPTMREPERAPAWQALAEISDRYNTDKLIADAGLPGVKYLDQHSRGAGQGSRNYVVRDPALIEILRKYGLLGPVAAGATANALMGNKNDQ